MKKAIASFVLAVILSAVSFAEEIRYQRYVFVKEVGWKDSNVVPGILLDTQTGNMWTLTVTPTTKQIEIYVLVPVPKTPLP